MKGCFWLFSVCVLRIQGVRNWLPARKGAEPLLNFVSLTFLVRLFKELFFVGLVLLLGWNYCWVGIIVGFRFFIFFIFEDFL